MPVDMNTGQMMDMTTKYPEEFDGLTISNLGPKPSVIDEEFKDLIDERLKIFHQDDGIASNEAENDDDNLLHRGE